VLRFDLFDLLLGIGGLSPKRPRYPVYRDSDARDEDQ
jgi:hypothetical protein